MPYINDFNGKITAWSGMLKPDVHIKMEINLKINNLAILSKVTALLMSSTGGTDLGTLLFPIIQMEGPLASTDK